MRNLFTKEMHTVSPGQAVAGIARRPQTLHVNRGRVWLTVEGIAHDYFLHAGDTFAVAPGRLVVVEADQDASLQVRHSAVSHAWKNVRRRLSASVERLLQGGTTQASPEQRCTGCNASA
jgi:hypothetical protein